MSKVFVTGANGFMGSHIVRSLLARGREVVALVGTQMSCENLAGLNVDERQRLRGAHAPGLTSFAPDGGSA